VSSTPLNSSPAANADQTRWFTEEVHPHEPALRAYLRKKFPSMSDVDDVVQDSYVQLWKGWRSGHITSVKGYLFATARNTALKVFRRRRIISDTPVSQLPAWRILDQGNDGAEATDCRMQDELVTEAGARLPDRCREIFLLRVARGWSYAEIAREFGISEGTVRVQVARGLNRCRQYMRELGAMTDQ
jgi:RNA polymerase sigma-70 factor (ECF subfamily)